MEVWTQTNPVSKFQKTWKSSTSQSCHISLFVWLISEMLWFDVSQIIKWNVSILSTQSWKFEICCPWKNIFAYFCLLFSFSHEPTEFYISGTWCYVYKVDPGVLFFFFVVLSTILSLPKCGKGKPALVRRNTVDDKSELIACIETGNFAKAARIAAGEFAALCI